MKVETLRTICVAVVLVISACSNASKAPSEAPAVQGESSKPGAFLAYEHTVSVEMSADAIPAHVAAARSACAEVRFGACSVLRIDEHTGSYFNAKLIVRIVPDGVEPIVKVAADGGTIGSRSTKAEDRADVVADIAHKTEMLRKQREKLSEYDARKDLPVADRLVLARELASIELQMDDLAAASKNENRRIETNLLTLDFLGNAEGSRWSKVYTSASGFFEQFLDGTSQVIEVVAYGLPFILLAFPLALVWRWLWRRVTGKSRS
jgi:Domain of unknown function (DUF4349)